MKYEISPGRKENKCFFLAIFKKNKPACVLK